MTNASSGSEDRRPLPFTAAARGLLAAAQAEAAGLRHEYIGTEHVLLALSGDAAGGALLTRLGVDPGRVRATLLAAVRPGEVALPPAGERPYTSRTQQVLALAAASARALGREEVGVEHLLAGVAREGRGIGAQVLLDQGLTAERARWARSGARSPERSSAPLSPSGGGASRDGASRRSSARRRTRRCSRPAAGSVVVDRPPPVSHNRDHPACPHEAGG